MAINYDNRSTMQNWANGVCPVQQPAVQTVVVQPTSDNCMTQACPAPTQQPIILDPDRLFTDSCGEIVMCLDNEGATSVPLIYGLGAVEGFYQNDPRLVPSAVDTPTVHSCDDFWDPANPGNAPYIDYINNKVNSRVLYLRAIYIQVNAADPLATQANAKLTKKQFTWALDSQCSQVQYPPVCTQSCPGGDFVAGNITARFEGQFVLDTFNGFSYPLLPGSQVEVRLCVAGEGKIVTSYPCAV